VDTPLPEPLPDDWEDQDFSGCFALGVQLAGEAVRRGEPLPLWLRSARAALDDDVREAKAVRREGKR
jgi:hypothetical protein